MVERGAGKGELQLVLKVVAIVASSESHGYNSYA